MSERRLILKGELAHRGLRYRDLAAQLRAQGFDVEEFDVARAVAGRWDPPVTVRQAIAGILERPTYELF